MFEKIKDYVLRWQTCIEKYRMQSQYIRAALSFLTPPIIIAFIIILTAKASIAVFNFLRLHYVQLVMLALGLWAFAAWLDKHRAEKIKHRQIEAEQEERSRYLARKEYAATKDATYVEQAKMIFQISRELCGIGIIPPARLSNLYSPNRTIPKLNGEVILCLYLLEKDRETVDLDLLKQTLQRKIDQRLMAGEFPGIPDKHQYRGRIYSGFIIDTVRDGEGYLEVYTAIVNDAYCRYKENRDLSGDIPPSYVDRRDIDY